MSDTQTNQQLLAQQKRSEEQRIGKLVSHHLPSLVNALAAVEIKHGAQALPVFCKVLETKASLGWTLDQWQTRLDELLGAE